MNALTDDAMRYILRNLPISDHESTVAVPSGTIVVRPYQIMVWVSITAREVTEIDPHAPAMPAILDTGNRSGTRDIAPRGSPVSLAVAEGIAVYPTEMPNVARLPTLGLRALIRNKLNLAIDGEQRLVSLRGPT